jgi:exosortase
VAVSELPAQVTTKREESPPAPAPAAPPGDFTGRSLALAAIPLAALVVLIFWDTLAQLRAVWDLDPSYSHGYLVPLASLGFAWLAWKRSRPDLSEALSRRGMIAGSLEIVLGLALHAAGWLLSTLLLDVLALICVIRGLLLLVGGPSVNQRFGFAALFLIFMAPLPPPVYQALALWMQHFVSVISAACLEIMGIAAYRQGYMIYLSDYTMEVGEACSGLRQLTAVLALGVAIGELYQNSRPTRWLLALIALPVAVGANCLRVTLSGVIMVLFGAKWAEGVFHTLEGLATILLAAGALLAIAGLLSRWEQKRGKTAADSGAREAKEALA